MTGSRRIGISYPDRGGAYQYFDQVGVIEAMCKWSCCAPTADRIPELLRKALRKCFEQAWSGAHRCAEDVINGATKPVPILKPHQYRRVEPIHPTPDQVDKVTAMLADTRLPLIHAGSGVIHAPGIP